MSRPYILQAVHEGGIRVRIAAHGGESKTSPSVLIASPLSDYCGAVYSVDKENRSITIETPGGYRVTLNEFPVEDLRDAPRLEVEQVVDADTGLAVHFPATHTSKFPR